MSSLVHRNPFVRHLRACDSIRHLPDHPGGRGGGGCYACDYAGERGDERGDEREDEYT